MTTRLLLYPERQRCRNCRRYFAFEVVLRQYCSDECAGRPPRSSNVEDLPRSCRAWHSRERAWHAKQVFYTEREAQHAASRKGAHWYHCSAATGCGEYHLSKSPTPAKEG